MFQSKKLPKSVPLLSMKEQPGVELTLALFFQNILHISKSVLSKGRSKALWKPRLAKPEILGQTCATVNRIHTLEGTMPIVDVHPSTSLHLAFFRDLSAPLCLAHLYVMFPSTGAKLFSLLDILL